MPRVALHTLGCKVNQYETEKIAEGLRAQGCEVVRFSDLADIYIINTCTVTQVADSKSRQMVRSAVRRNPEAKVVVTGCFAETSPDQASSLEGVALVVGNKDKHLLPEKVLSLITHMENSALRTPHSALRGRTRALLKIQDGCNQFCSYCAVPFARSSMECKPFKELIEEASDLAERGYKEIVLTGIRLGLYEDGEADLTHVLRELMQINGIERIRLSSIELTDIRPGLIDLMAASEKVCRHLHIPLQSGDDRVLARMNRPYTSRDFADFVCRARKLLPEIAITTDIMVGFPGETEDEFETSYNFAEEICFSRMHVFRYSPRPVTLAASMPNPVHDAEKDRRSARLIELGARCSEDFAHRLIGKDVSVLVEARRNTSKGLSGLTDNYIRVAFDGARDLVGKIVEVEVESAVGETALGKLL